MSLETIYVVRHGFRCSWFVDPVTGATMAPILSPTRIPADPPLTSHGVDQSKELAAHLLKADPPIDAVYSSPYYRCLQTITPFVSLRNEHSGFRDRAPLVIRPERGLSEFFGTAPFDHPVPAEPAVLKELFPLYDETYRSRVTPARKGEGIGDLYARVRSALEEIIEQCDAEGIRTVILCSHAAVIIAMGRVLTGEIPESVDVKDFGAFTCGLSRFKRGTGASKTQTTTSGEMSRTGNWICEANSDCSFMKGGEERGWSFSGDEAFAFGDRMPGLEGAAEHPQELRPGSQSGSSKL